ncbi:MAG: DUF2203 domain-containing protein [Thaumarchaeota archaeon]|nr:DUF2203 domain-containing protein [Nitrososphaerota archaeon]
MKVVCFPLGKNLSNPPSLRKANRITSPTNGIQHLFTPQEASKLLSDIKPKIKELIERKKVVTKLHAELERYNLLGFKTSEVAESAALLDSLVEGMTKKISELEDLGVIVKDLDYGLIDFPAEKYGESVLLCWRYGESEVSFWHKSSDGFTGRKPLKAAQLILP